MARAMAKDPLLVIGDEPTGNLDQVTSGDILKLIRKMSKGSKTTFILATHDPVYQKIASRVVEIRDGRVVGSK